MVVKKALSNWKSLNAALKKLSEKQLSDLLASEKRDDKRPTFLARIYGRYSRVREMRERRELNK